MLHCIALPGLFLWHDICDGLQQNDKPRALPFLLMHCLLLPESPSILLQDQMASKPLCTQPRGLDQRSPFSTPLIFSSKRKHPADITRNVFIPSFCCKTLPSGLPCHLHDLATLIQLPLIHPALLSALHTCICSFIPGTKRTNQMNCVWSRPAEIPSTSLGLSTLQKAFLCTYGY